eukprot:3369648-Amphidinium_carterae.1
MSLNTQESQRRELKRFGYVQALGVRTLPPVYFVKLGLMVSLILTTTGIIHKPSRCSAFLAPPPRQPIEASTSALLTVLRSGAAFR